LISIAILSILVTGCTTGSLTTSEITPTVTPLYNSFNGTVSKNIPIISAMDGFSVAEKEALSWKSDAISGDIIGTVIDPNENLPINGKTTKWLYFFSSPPSKNPLDSLIIVVYGDGTISNSQKGPNNIFNPDGLGYYNETHLKADWNVDSTQAVQTALKLFKTKYNMDAVAAGYTLTDNRTNGMDNDNFYWEIVLLGPSNDTSMPALFSENKLRVYIDATTGAVITDPHLTDTK
jgi:hypothetical protein